MAVLPVQIIAPTFPDGYCPPSLQQFANDFASGSQISAPISLDTLVISDTAPTDHSKAWFKTSAGLPFAWPSPPIYVWSGAYGCWVAANPSAPSTHRWEEFTGAGDITTYEGGAVGAVTAITGPFWEIDTNYDGRSPMSPGVISGADPAKTLGYGESYGAGTVNLTQLLAHLHVYGRMNQVNVNDDYLLVQGTVANATLTGPQILGADAVGLANPAQALGTGVINGVPMAGPYLNTGPMANSDGTTPTTVPVQVVQPVRGMSCIKRTGRLFYVG